MNNLTEHKRELIARSDYYRQSMAADIRQIKNTVAWIPRTIQILRWASPLVAVAAPIAAMLLGKRVKPQPQAPKKPSVLAKIMAGIEFYRKAKSIIDYFRPARPPQSRSA